MVRTTLGPRGMDKLVADGRRVTISNDGATIMRLLEIEHPAAKTLVDISMSQVSTRSLVVVVVVVVCSSPFPPPLLKFIVHHPILHTHYIIIRMPRSEMARHR